MAIYRDYNELSEAQEAVMKFIINWVNTKKTPVPKREIVKSMKKKKMTYDAIDDCLTRLIVKGYIRRSAYPERQNVTEFVQLRGL